MKLYNTLTLCNFPSLNLDNLAAKPKRGDKDDKLHNSNHLEYPETLHSMSSVSDNNLTPPNKRPEEELKLLLSNTEPSTFIAKNRSSKKLTGKFFKIFVGIPIQKTEEIAPSV